MPQPVVPKERVFDTNGETVEEIPAEEPEVVEEPVAEEEAPEDPGTPVPAAAHKYRIGDKTFATQAEALAYAEASSGPASEVDAYRQVLREAIAQVPRPGTVTPPPAPPETPEEFYTNPNEFLRKRDERLRAEVLQQIQQSQATTDADNRIWREFMDRHPDLADFREEIATLAQRIQPEVHAVSRTKGQAAAYDYVATKFKAQVERITSALKPKRALSNSAVGGAAGNKVETVTPKTPAKKPSTMSDQIRNMRKRR